LESRPWQNDYWWICLIFVLEGRQGKGECVKHWITYVAIPGAWIWTNNYWQSRPWQKWKLIDLSVFYSRRKARQRRMCAALNHLCSCPGSPDMGDYFWGAATIGNNKSTCLSIKLTAIKEEVSASVCSFEPAMQLPWLAQKRSIVFRTSGTPKWFCNPSFTKLFLKNHFTKIILTKKDFVKSFSCCS